ncbi:MAG: trigger factor [Parcubacteria group bacterium]|jgi:trigger factor
MQIKKLPKSQIEFEIVVPAEEFKTFIKSASQELSKEIKIDGFRPGKAPREIVEKKIGAEKVLAHGAEKAVKKSYADAIVKNKIEAIGEPKITITKIAPGNNLEYKAVVSVMPEINVGDYRKQAKSVKLAKDAEIDEKQIDKEIENLQKSRAKLVTVLREVRAGDKVEIDFQVRIDGKEIPQGSSKNHPLVVGESYFIPGFEDKLLGMKEKEEKEFELTFPKDYHQEELAGKAAMFKVKVNLIQERQLPELNDEFVKNLGHFNSLSELRSSIKDGLGVEQKKRNEDSWRNEVMESIIKNSEVEVPDLLIENELDKMMSEFEQNISSMGMNVDTYLENIKKTRDGIRKGWEENAIKRVKSALALKKIAEEEGIEIPSTEIEAEMNKAIAYLKSISDMENQLDLESLYAYTKSILANEAVFKLLAKS